MQTFYFIRHGQKQPIAGEPELTELGHQQAEATGNFLKQFPIQRIFASPSMRTQQTAQHIGQHLQLPFSLDALLRERANWGEDPAQSFSQFLDMWGRATQDRSYKPPIGDSSLQAGQRVEQIVDLIRKDSGEHVHVALITHGGVIGDFLRNIFGDEKLDRILKEFKQHHPGDYAIRECSITTVTFHGKTPELKMLASVEHLEPLHLTKL